MSIEAVGESSPRSESNLTFTFDDDENDHSSLNVDMRRKVTSKGAL